MYIRELADGTVVAEVYLGRDKNGKKKRKTVTFHPPENVEVPEVVFKCVPVNSDIPFLR